jgi:membrane peptidoglycan carboxypeptidase
MRASQVTTIYAADDSTVLDRIVPDAAPSTYTKLSDVPQQLRQAVLAAEDRDFYRHPSFSITGFLRAVRDNVMGDPNAGGGSTITQQYVKNAMLSPQRSLWRKTKELIIATKMARQWSKDDILEAYLNTIYFGRGAYGISDAAQAYFAKPVGQLTLDQDAVLAALIRQPSVLSRDDHRDQLRDRWNYVLDGMVDMHVLTPDDRAAVRFPSIAPEHESQSAERGRGGPERLIRAQVLRELATAGIPDKAVGGLHVTTTIDAKAQRAAADAVASTLSDQPDYLRAAVVSVDPRNGAVRAYYGGSDGSGYDFAQAPLQTGSTFKVFALAAALEQGAVSLDTQFSSAPLTVHGITISNADGESCGTCSIARALEMSLNTSFYRLELALGPRGPQLIADAAHQAGIPRTIPGVAGPTLSENGGPPNDGIVLGQYLVRPIDMASAYATFAAHGRYYAPHFVAKVTDGDGTVLLDNTTRRDGEPAIPRDVADQVTEAMLPVAAYSNGHQLAGRRPSAAKTGTTQFGTGGGNKDAWMIGFTPSLSTAVWVGPNTPRTITTSGGAPIYGAGLPADIWKQTMDGALAGTPMDKFDVPDASMGLFGPVTPQQPLIVPAPSTRTTPSTAPRQTAPGGPIIIPGPGQLVPQPPPEPAPIVPAPVTPQPVEPAPPGGPIIVPGPAAPPAPPVPGGPGQIIVPAPGPQPPVIQPAPR